MKIVVIPTLAGCAIFASCATSAITYSDGEKVVIEHLSMVDDKTIDDLAKNDCARSSKAKAVRVAQAGRAEGMAPGSAVRLTTFRCEP